MGSNRYWYNNGQFETLESNSEFITRILINSDKGLHICWRTSGSRIPFYFNQFEFLQYLLNKNCIKLESASHQEFIFNEISSLLRRNRIFKGSLVHIFFIPPIAESSDSTVGIFAFTEKYMDEKFIMNPKGLHLGLLRGFHHPGELTMAGLNYKGSRSSLWGKDLTKHKIDTGYLCNSSNRIVDCIDSSVFLIKGNGLYTPSLEMGAIPRAIRQVVIKKAALLKLKIIETDKLEPGHLDAADEIFVANDIMGIQWVVAHNNNRYFRKFSGQLLDMINSDWEKGL